MKKFLSLALSVVMLLSLIPFSAFAAAPETVLTVTDSDNAYESISAALAADTADVAAVAINSTNWSIENGTTFNTLAKYSSTQKKQILLHTYSDDWKDVAVSGFSAYRYVNASGTLKGITLAAYDESSTFDTVEVAGNSSFPVNPAKSGVMLAVTPSNNYTSITYTAPKSGTVSLSDPTGSDIATVSEVGGVNAKAFNDGAHTTVAIYKNDEKIWPAVGDTVTLNINSPAVEFPTLDNISVSAGDKLRIVAKTSATHGTCVLALNPQIDYVEETVKVISSNAYEDLSAALAEDKGADSKNGLANSYWSIGTYDGSSGIYTDCYESATIGDLKIQKNFGSYDMVTYSGVEAYRMGSGNNNCVYPYNIANSATITPRYRWDDSTNFPVSFTEKGVLLTGDASLKFTAPKDGYVKLYDPTGGKIVAVASINGQNTYCFDDNSTNKYANFTITKNGEKIWPTDKDSCLLNRDNNGPNVDFPEIETYLEEGDVITFNFVAGGANSNAFTLNPQVDYIETEADVAADALNAALEADKANGTKKFLNGTNWSFKQNGEIVSDVQIDTYKTSKNTDPYLNTAPYSAKKAYSPNPYWHTNLTAYDADDFEVFEGRCNGADVEDYVCKLPESGIVFSTMIDVDSVAFTYTAPKTGKINLYDPDGGYIEAVKSIGSVNQTGSLDTSDKTATLAIYKNGEKIWPENAAKYNFNYQNTYVEFPEVKGIDVNAGDTIEMVFEKSKTGPLSMALNPAVEYYTPETGDMNADGYINILDLVRMKKKLVDLSDAKKAYDVTGDGVFNASDLIEMRKFLLGVTDVFKVDMELPENIISHLVTAANGKTYVEKDGQPYDMTAVHIRPDLIIQKYEIKDKDKEGYDTYLKPYFAAAAELGFNAINLQLHWRVIETAQGVFDWSFLETVYEYLNEYNLDIQLLWCGSDNCGYYYDNVPAYVRNGVGTTYTSITADNGVVYLDYSDEDLVKAETNAVANLMNWLAENDTAHRTAAIQIENEPNYGVPGVNTTPDADATAQEVAAITWVGGQEDAILNLINEIGLVIKNSDYSVVTRVNFVSFHCSYNGVSDSLAKVNALPGVDLVGMSCFEPDMTMDSEFMKKLAAIDGNIPYIAESVAGYASLFAKTLNAYDLGGFLMPYELKASDNINNAMSIFEVSDDISFTYRDGSDIVSNFNNKDYYESNTTDWIGFNNMVKAVGAEIAVADTEDFAVYNLEQSTTSSQTLAVGERSFTLENTVSENYGSVGFALKASDGSYLIYIQKGGELTVNGITVSGCISKGYYENGQWVETGKRHSWAGGNQFSLDANSVYRITPDQFK